VALGIVDGRTVAWVGPEALPQVTLLWSTSMEQHSGWWDRLQGSILNGNPAPTDKAGTGGIQGAAAPEDVTSTRGTSSASQSTTSWTPPTELEQPNMGGHGLLGQDEADIAASIPADVPVELPLAPPAAAGVVTLQLPRIGQLQPGDCMDGSMGQPCSPSEGNGTDGASAPQVSQSPRLHCSEFFQAVIAKQHEVERLLTMPTQDIPQSIMTKMAMMKNELEMLSCTIRCVLGKHAGVVETASALMTAAPGQLRAGDPRFADHVPQPAQIWPKADLMPAEEHLVEPMGGMTQQYACAGTMESHTAVHYPEDPQGPAIFQGFQPPPSYAWCRSPTAERSQEGRSNEGISGNDDATPQGAETPAPQQPPRPRSVIDTSSPPRAVPVESSMKHAFTVAMEELQRCQSACAMLRSERRGIPAKEVERWCGNIATQLQQIGDVLGDKLAVHRRKSQAKDETIKRLYGMLQVLQQQMPAGSVSGPVGSPDVQRSPKTRRGLLHDSPVLRPVSNSPSRVCLPQGHVLSTGVTGTSGAADGLVSLRTPRSSSGAVPGALGPEFDANGKGTAEGAAHQHDDADKVQRPATPPVTPAAVTPAEGSMIGSIPRVSSSSNTLPEEKQLLSTMARVQGRRLADQASQKLLARAPAAEKSQPGQARREVAHARRRDVDLAGQLRQRDAQVEHLTSALRELQLVTQRQIGLYKRQLLLKDNSLQALQEELLQQAPPGAVIGGAPTVLGPNNTEVQRGSVRRHCLQAPMTASTGSLAQAASAGMLGSLPSGHDRRTGATPRAPECERGRTTATWLSVPKKEPRDRSLGAMPHSPRNRHRDVPGQAIGGSGNEVALTRRKTSPTGALGRSTSADGPARRRQDSDITVANAAAAAVSKATRGPATARQRR